MRTGKQLGVKRGGGFHSRMVLGILLAVTTLLDIPSGRAAENRQPDFLTQHWSARDGILENSAFGVAQTPDGYIWVASAGGLLRFNGRDFTAASQLFDNSLLGNASSSVIADARGRLWLGKDTTIMLGDSNVWVTLTPTNLQLRTVAVVGDETFLGTSLGEIYRLEGQALRAVEPPPGLTASGVFCVRDEADGGLWVANRTFIGRRTATGWERVERATNLAPAVVAGAARGGGLWVYGSGKLRRYRSGQATATVPAPAVDQPRQVFEDRQGRVWIVSAVAGLTVIQPNGTWIQLNANNGLTHNSALMMIQDQEDNFWIGSSVGGLQRLRDRDFKITSTEEGLPDHIVKTVTTSGAKKILLGTHGGGAVRLDNGAVAGTEIVSSDRRLRYVWSVCRDSRGREWLGTYGSGLFVLENGVLREFPLPAQMGQAIYALMEDSQKRLWVGAYSGVGYISGDEFTPVTPPDLGRATVRGFAEEPQTGAIWIGTFGRGLFRLAGTNLTHLGTEEGLPGNRVSSLTWDEQGGLWAGIFKRGLVYLRDGKISRVNSSQGLPADTIGSMLADSEGYFWLGSDRGVLRVRQVDLRRGAADEKFLPPFTAFNEGDGLDNAGCSEGYQPSAVTDEAGVIWFATLNGLVSINPRTLHINQRPPPVKIEKVTYRDVAGMRRVLVAPGEKIKLPAGSTELEIYCAALSFAAPQKVTYAFQLEDSLNDWIYQGNERVIYFHNLEHGDFRLHVKAANNDGVWNETGATLSLTVAAFFWQTWWFRGLLAVALLVLGGVIVSWLQREKLQYQKLQLRQQQVLAEEQARLASVLEGTTDLVSFASPSGQILYINPAGRRLLGLTPQQPATQFHLRHFFPLAQAEQIFQTAIPQAIGQGTWTGQTILQTNTQALPVSQVIVAHKNTGGELLFLSTIIRDVSERQRQEDELKKKNSELERFTYTVSHDLKSPLITIKGFAAALLGDLAANRTERLQEDLNRIVHATDKMTGLLNGLLELSRIGRIINPPRPVALERLAAEVVELLNGPIQAKHARVSIAPGLPVVSGDAQRLQEVLQNLLENALKFAQENQPPIIEIGAVAGADSPTIFVRDNGRGIEPHHLVTIFGLFNKLDHRTSGHGLGLALAQRIVEFHGGKIWAESAGLGQGATFYFTLPAA